jgi:hypothetical protein
MLKIAIAVLVGLIVFFILRKLFKFAVKLAVIVALLGAAGYLAYVYFL